MIVEMRPAWKLVRVDMESSSSRRELSISSTIARRVWANDVGIVLQSYLRRTYEDAQELVKLPARIRICKAPTTTARSRVP